MNWWAKCVVGRETPSLSLIMGIFYVTQFGEIDSPPVLWSGEYPLKLVLVKRYQVHSLSLYQSISLNLVEVCTHAYSYGCNYM